MNDLEALSKAMKLATEVVIHEKYKHLKGLDNFQCRVGTGSATNVTRKGHQLSSYRYVLTYGIKMLISKQTKKSALGWTTGKEIMSRNYFNRKPTYKNFVVSVILHEYAHAVQFVTDGFEKGSVHNAAFYKILDGFYEKNYHIELDKYLSAFPAYTSADYLNDERSMSAADIVGAKYLEFKEREKLEIVKIVKINRTRVACIRVNGNETTIPFAMIERVFVNEKDLPNGSFSATKLVRKKTPKRPKESITPAYIRSNDIKYITILTRRSKTETFRIERLNEKNAVGKDINSGEIYNIPYSIIIECHQTLPKGMSEVADIPKKIKKESAFNRSNLSVNQIVEIDLRGEIVKFEIEKLNITKFIGKMVDSHKKYNISYVAILKAY